MNEREWLEGGPEREWLDGTAAARTPVHLCGDTACPSDPAFDHRSYFGCVPKDFTERTGRSKTNGQTRGPDGIYRWDGGCDAAGLAHAPAPSPSISETEA